MNAFRIPILCALLLCGMPADQSRADGWTFRLVPYAWLSGQEGVVGIGGTPPADIDKSASDILDEVEAAFFIVGSARKGRLVIACDLAWVELEDSASLPDGGTASITTESFTGTAYVGYDLGIESRAEVDVIAGVRGYSLDNTLTVPGLVQASDDQGWADPILGLRVSIPITETVGLSLDGDIGGFGIGSDFAWQLQPVVRWQFARSWSSYVGYRYVDVDYEEDGFLYDVSLQGVLLGIGYRF